VLNDIQVAEAYQGPVYMMNWSYQMEDITYNWPFKDRSRKLVKNLLTELMCKSFNETFLRFEETAAGISNAILHKTRQQLLAL